MERRLISKNTSLKVLILEDSLFDLELVTEHISDAGYQPEVTHVESEADFREALMKNKFDIILSDFGLPGFDAFGALEIAIEISPEVPFICVSGSIGEETAIELLKKGAVDYVLKDRPGRLPFAINRALTEVKEKTLRKKADLELKESENRFRQVAETAQEWIWEVNTQGKYTYSSPVIEKLLGFTPEEVVKHKYFYDLYLPEKRTELKHRIFKIMSKKGILKNFENIKINNNGESVYILTCASPVFDDAGNLTGYRGADKDITIRKKAEGRLKLLNRAVESSLVSVIITDAKGNINYVNPFFTKITGYSYNEIIGKNLRFLQAENQQKILEENLWKTINSGKDWSGEILNKKKNGNLYWENALISPILNSNGHVLNFVTIAEDITERKKMVEDLVVAKEKAEESDQLKTAFINNISHEVRTPLNGILGFGHLITEFELTPEKRGEYFKQINKSSERLLSTITDYMDMAMIVSKTMKPNIQEIDPAIVFLMVSERAKQLCEDKKINLEIKIPEETNGLIIHSDPEFIQKILNKLIDNSLKFTKEGIIAIGYRIKPELIEFFVKDTGCGIEECEMEMIFEMFHQEDISMTREYEGSGLGLSIAKALATLVRGQIMVTSEKGTGSEFTFTIPLSHPIRIKKT